MDLNIDEEDHSQSVKKPDHNNSMSQANSSSNTTDVSMDRHRPTSQTTNMMIQSIRQNSTHLSNPMYQTPELTQQRKMQPNQLDSQQQLQRRKIRIGISIKRKDRSLQGVTKKTPPHILKNVLKSIRQALSTTHNNLLSNNPQLEARMSPLSAGDYNVDLTTSPQNIIASETSDRQSTERPSRPIYKPSIIQHTTTHENGYQKLCTGQLFDQSTRTNSETKRVHIIDDTARSPVTACHLNVMDNACQTDACMAETLSLNNAVTSDSDVVTDQTLISDHERSADEAPAEITNNEMDTANDSGHGSADRPTATQNSTARSHQISPNLEEQMLDNFAALFTQMGSTLRYVTNMYNTLRSSILDTAETYRKLLDTVEQLNTTNTASNTSPSSNLIPKVPPSPKERHTEVTASASSSNKDQHSNDFTNKTSKKNHNKLYRFVLPPEYDAFDTSWTLKYRTNLPGLVELMPQSGVYVSLENLKYCQQVSKDCKSLALRLLSEVFNRTALSVCSSMSEKTEASNNVGSNIRPDLDDHACFVLINFVLEHGLQRGWNTDLQPILSTLHSSMQENRFKYGVILTTSAGFNKP